MPVLVRRGCAGGFIDCIGRLLLISNGRRFGIRRVLAMLDSGIGDRRSVIHTVLFRRVPIDQFNGICNCNRSVPLCVRREGIVEERDHALIIAGIRRLTVERNGNCLTIPVVQCDICTLGDHNVSNRVGNMEACKRRVRVTVRDVICNCIPWLIRTRTA